VPATSDALYINQAVLTVLPITMAAWFYATNLTARHTIIAIEDKDTGDNRVLRLTANGAVAGDPLQAIHRGSTTFGIASSSSAYTENTWQHAVGVFAAANSRQIYLNGGNSGTDATGVGTITPLNRTIVGAWGFTAGSFTNVMNGYIADISIWNVALTNAEVTILAKGFSPLLVRPQSLVFYIPLIRDNDKDLIGGLSMTMNGSPGIVSHPRVLYPGHN